VSLPVDVPQWLLVGIALGVLATLLIAAAFLVGNRLFPAPDQPRGRRVGGEERRRAEIREYLRGIDEPFDEDRTIEGQSVSFYLPERGVAITFDARAYFVLERSGVDAILVEHELPGARLGGRLPFETPGGTSGDGETAVAFTTLGLEPPATDEEVKRAYRERVKEVHPDHGGDVEAFERVREAYTVASERAK